MKVIFVCGIDTEVGKTYLSGSILGQLCYKNYKVASYKPIQTGSEHTSIDLEEQKRIATEYCLSRDNLKSFNNYLGNSMICSYIFQLHSSPHLASANEGQYVKVEKLVEDFKNYLTKLYAQNNLTNLISDSYTKLDYLLVEFAGGVLSPVNDLLNNLDLLDLYLQICQEKKVESEVVLVTNGKLGSISHTLASIKLLPRVDYLVYNNFPFEQEQLSQLISNSNLHYYLNLQEVATALSKEQTDSKAYELITSYKLKDSYLLQDTSLIEKLQKLKIVKFNNLNSTTLDF
ncbi:dethiobiotin synthase [Psittacicella hinzii]|uniref:ATP-dependent dethiobiotin synthetase BioD n=1 Tax=Psittacicella hinzii TaxID=2028575 RepID=A0A3A1Y797_9GAMM|nr:dethiobiotin synthase [Psittacicella hinzii]RIY34153.1 dethiobiotin synthase [Psittacicella hinzii]